MSLIPSGKDIAAAGDEFVRTAEDNAAADITGQIVPAVKAAVDAEREKLGSGGWSKLARTECSRGVRGSPRRTTKPLTVKVHSLSFVQGRP